MQAYKMWKTSDVLERVDILFSRARREEIERHNKEVRQNREILRTLSEAVLYLAKQELPFRSHDKNTCQNLILSLSAAFMGGLLILKKELSKRIISQLDPIPGKR